MFAMYQWIRKFGPLQHLVTDRGTEYDIQDMAHLCYLLNNNHNSVLHIPHGQLV